MDRWRGKVALVTGASVGIGQDIAIVLAKNGMKVIIAARRLKKLQDLSMKLKLEHNLDVYPIRCDVREEAEILKMFKWAVLKLGGVDVLINNAGTISRQLISVTAGIKYRNILSVNICAVAICSRELTRSVKQRNTFGHIINIGSVVGHTPEAFNIPMNIYPASKCGIIGLTISLRNELRRLQLDIRVTDLSPGPAATDMMWTLFKPEDPLRYRLPLLSSIDIAEVVIFILSTPQCVEISNIIMQAHKPKLYARWFHA